MLIIRSGTTQRMGIEMSEVIRRGRYRWWHWCPACERAHPLPDGWQFDGNLDVPTFSPDFRQTFYHPKLERAVSCHYHVVAGKIQFCVDSWHARSDIVSMPIMPADLILDDPTPA